MFGEVQHQRLTFDSFPYKGWLIGGFVRTYTTTRVTSCVTTTSHAPCYYTHYYAALLMLPHLSIINSCAQLYHCPAACLDQSLGFLNPTICRLSSQGDKYCDKIWQKFCLSFSKLLFCNTVRLVRASWPFDPVYEKWRRATEKILRTSDILDGAEELKIWIQPLVFYLRSFKKCSDHYSDELFKSDQFHLETGQK